jgi:hypothetical protein
VSQSLLHASGRGEKPGRAAFAVVQAQGGQLALSNRPEGGLRASITLPT